jgi:DNA primase small subunit
MSELVHELFFKYYSECFEQIEVPSSCEKREFGAMPIGQKKMLRHRSLKDGDELHDFLNSFIPSDVYYSIAYYENPEATEMNGKGWTGADLVFDIDADHIPTTCEKIHDEWVCSKCSLAGRGAIPDICPICGAEKFEVKTWPCDACINSAKQETIKLLDMLTNDFGLSKKDIRIFFSGHRGYHLHVEDKTVQDLDSIARKEIVDYVTALGFDTTNLNLTRMGTTQSNLQKSLSLSDHGWRGRVARGSKTFVAKAKQSDYEKLDLGINIANTLIRNKDRLIKSWEASGFLGPAKGIGVQTWKKILEYSVDSQKSNIDTVVTTDIHRLIRLAGSLHGKTGFKKIKLDQSGIDSFDPFKNAIAFKTGTATIHVASAPEFRVGDETFGPYTEQTVTLPTSAALLLVCKNRAKVVQ